MNYHGIESDSMLNGDGLRTILWISGCKIGCKNCHNPQTHSFNSGALFDELAENELWEKLKPNYISGLTLSGGNPLEPENRAMVYLLANKFKTLFPKKTLWIYTGYTWEYCLSQPDIKNILEKTDVLCDGPFIEKLKDNTSNCKWVGSCNQKVIDVKRSLAENKVVLWV